MSKSRSFKVSIDSIIVIMLLLHISIFNYFNLASTTNKVITLLIIVRMLYNNKSFYYLSRFVVALIVAIIVGFVSAKLGDDYLLGNYLSNISYLLYPLVMTFYLAWLSVKKEKFITKLINESFWIINIYFIINVIVIFIQDKIPGFMMGYASWSNNLHEDFISGLFGYSATAQLGAFSCFVVLFNLYHIKYKIKRYANVYKIYNYAVIALVLITSRINDNKIVFVSLPLLLITFYVFSIGNKSVSKRALYIIIITVVIIVGWTILVDQYRNNESFRRMLPSRLPILIDYIIDAVYNPRTAYRFGDAGSMERIYMILFFLSRPDKYLLGFGLGLAQMQKSGTLGFYHFGQGDLGALLCLGGILFTASIYYMHIYLTFDITRMSKKNSNNILKRVLILLTLFLFSFYSQPFTHTTLQICLFLIYIMFGQVDREIKAINSRS